MAGIFIFPLISFALGIFVLLPFALMFGAKIANISKKDKNGQIEMIGYKTALVDTIVAGTLAGLLSKFNPIVGIIGFFIFI